MSTSEAIVFSGLDEAVVGLARRCGRGDVVAYSETKVLEILIAQGMSEEDAREFYEFNIVGAYIGDGTPVFLVEGGVADDAE